MGSNPENRNIIDDYEPPVTAVTQEIQPLVTQTGGTLLRKSRKSRKTRKSRNQKK